MKYRSLISFSVATVSLSLLVPQLANAQTSTPEPQRSAISAPAPAGTNEAMAMVHAQAALERVLDAKKATPGEQFEAKLASKVDLRNGPELPRGTVLVGKVGTDDMNVNGVSKLALRFTQAQLKDGQTVPIKATIVSVYGPDAGDFNPYSVAPGDQVPTSWNDGTLSVDQLNALSGVDLHSKIASNNSGVLVSTKNDDVKLRAGTEFALAIAEQPNGPQNQSGMAR
jgi:hypothetical protein